MTVVVQGGGGMTLAKSGDTALTGDVTLSEGANVTLTQTGQDIEITAGAGGSVAWGAVTGTLSDQTDLQSALNLKGNITSQTFVTPNIGVATATTINKVTFTQPAASATLTIANTKTLTVNGDTTLTNGTHSGTNTGDSASLPIGGGSLTGGLVLIAGTTVIAPIKFISGTNLTVPGAGVIEFDGAEFYITI